MQEEKQENDEEIVAATQIKAGIKDIRYRHKTRKQVIEGTLIRTPASWADIEFLLAAIEMMEPHIPNDSLNELGDNAGVFILEQE